MSADVILGEAAAAATVVAGLVALTPQGRGAIRRRRARNQDLDGIPARIEVDAEGKEVVVDKGRPSLAAAVAQLVGAVDRIDKRTAELTRNGGGSLADMIHQIAEDLREKHAENQHDIAELRQTAQGNADALREVASLAGQAATAAASADQRGREHDAESELFRNVVQQDVAHIWRILKEMGYDRREGSEG